MLFYNWWYKFIIWGF